MTKRPVKTRDINDDLINPELSAAEKSELGTPNNEREPDAVEQSVPGAKQTRKRLSEEAKSEIATRLSTGESAADLAKYYGVSYATVSIIKRGGAASTPRAAKGGAAPAGDSDLKKRLVAYAVTSLLTPDAVDAAERDALTKLLADDLQAKLDAVKTQYMLSI